MCVRRLQHFCFLTACLNANATASNVAIVMDTANFLLFYIKGCIDSITNLHVLHNSSAKANDIGTYYFILQQPFPGNTRKEDKTPRLSLKKLLDKATLCAEINIHRNFVLIVQKALAPIGRMCVSRCFTCGALCSQSAIVDLFVV